MSEKYKLVTHLRNFRYNRAIQRMLFTVDWFRYDLDENAADRISGFTYEELKQFEGFTLSHEFNFGEYSRNYHLTDEGEYPTENYSSWVPNEGISFPDFVVLKPVPLVYRGIGISKYMQIVLIDKSGKDCKYLLPFGAIGKITEAQITTP